ncbi:hypothetical protein SO802_005171 [Lithocarpus litseifolius]|uniref:Uncharacterized protein n=1 Tax=Lithocarpus litseifolius TaxID=425828 RepID=A0AAW2DK70_9ROSI
MIDTSTIGASGQRIKWWVHLGRSAFQEMDRNNKGKAVLIESDNNSPVGQSTLVLDDDEQSIQEILTSLENCCHPCKVTSEGDEVGTILRSLDGSCAYLVKPIPLRDLNMHINLKRKNDLVQVVQQQTNNVSRAKKPRMSWTPLVHEKFVESVQELGGIENATPKKILQLLQSNLKGFQDLDREEISSHLQKYRDSIKRKVQLHMLGYRDKDGTNSEHIQSIYQMKEHPPMTLVNQVLKTTVANEPDILSQQRQAPAAKNTQGFQSVTLPFETNLPTIGGSTSCGNQSNALMIQMDEAFSSEL